MLVFEIIDRSQEMHSTSGKTAKRGPTGLPLAKIALLFCFLLSGFASSSHSCSKNKSQSGNCETTTFCGPCAKQDESFEDKRGWVANHSHTRTCPLCQLMFEIEDSDRDRKSVDCEVSQISLNVAKKSEHAVAVLIHHSGRAPPGRASF